MRYLLIIFLLCPTLCYATSQDFRIGDNEGDILNINTDGTITPSSVSDGTNVQSGPVSIDYRISDNDGDVLKINSDGSVNGGV